MRLTTPIKFLPALALVPVLAVLTVRAQQAAAPGSPDLAKPTTAADAAQRDSSFIDEQGRAHITRIVPVPSSLSFP